MEVNVSDWFLLCSRMSAAGENFSTYPSTTNWLLVTAVTLSLYVFGTWNYDFFRKRNIASTHPKLPFLGDMLAELLGLRATPDSIKQRYKWGKGHGVFGFFEFMKPIFLIRDPEIVKEITVKQFGNFTNRRPIPCEKSDPLFHKNIFTLEGIVKKYYLVMNIINCYLNLFCCPDDTWRNMRSRLSPSFTPSKLKTMFPIVSKCAERMTDYLKQKYDALPIADSTEQSITCDIKDFCTRMANDVFLSTSMGVQCDSMQKPENEIYQMGKLLTDFNTWRSLVFHGYLVIPKLMKLMTLPILDRKATDFFGGLVREVTAERRAKGTIRSDLLQFLMDARRRRKSVHSCERRDSGDNIELTDEDMVSQVVIFLFAGFETLSTALSFTLYALSHHHDVQTRLQVEIDQVMTKTNGKFTYKAIQRMKYLDSVIKGERLALLEMKMALVHLLARFELLPSARSPYPARFQACFNLTPEGGF
ncbi:Cytochrome P450 9E1, partial [Gryllus bimaculatus]